LAKLKQTTRITYDCVYGDSDAFVTAYLPIWWTQQVQPMVGRWAMLAGEPEQRGRGRVAAPRVCSLDYTSDGDRRW